MAIPLHPTRKARLRQQKVSITLQFDDGVWTYRMTQLGRGYGTNFQPLLLSSIAGARARKFLEAVLNEAQPAHGSDTLWEQLELWDRSTL
jgi:hypothetical protein